ncbi:hypothetical protein RDWZM_000696 [Blomia tropicalis]|uniref:Uncharacterized protein n=1 Tax=Blomia tropicalis TaxID=40697 RepID=A0A9Q0MA74_BLOTA|nr:hypothetical protein RDWZM_000696 [Blomia tropicalis]
MGFKNRSETESQVRNALIAGSISGMVTKTLAAPIDRIKIYYQVRNKPFSFSEGMSVAKKIIKKRGIHSMWRGNSASLIRVVPYAAIQFTVHEQLKSIFDIRTYEQKLKKPGLCLTAGALAGLTAISCTYPLDVCRARMITDHTYKNVWEVMKRAFTSKDHKYGLYRGFMPAVIAIVPYTGVSFFVYELFKTRYFAQAKYSNDRLMLAIQK